MKITLSKSQWESIGEKAGWIKKSQNEYAGEHHAPGKEGAPLHDLTQLYPEDIYSNEAVRLYGNNRPYDSKSIEIIQSCRNRPNKSVRIYRAVPKLDSELYLKNLYDLRRYVSQYGFLPMSDNPKTKHISIPKEITDDIRYDKDKILNKLDGIISKQEYEYDKNPKIKINAGDWVTINLEYAKEHGVSNLNNQYKVLSKTVKASELYTEANSIYEWGYNP